jgi:hypothetical protein
MPCLTCGRRTRGATYCPEHDRDDERRHQKSRAHGLYDAAWRGPRGLRARVLERDRHLCQLGLRGCTFEATTVHLDASLEGDHSHATGHDCLSACAHCHGVTDGGRSAKVSV